MKAVSTFISAVLIVAFTVTVGTILITFFPSLVRTSTASTKTYIQRARSCVGGDFEIYYTKVCKSNLKKGLVLWLKLDEGSGNITYDYSGYGNNGSLYTGGEDSNTKWVDGKLGKALEFDGSNDWVKILDSESLKPSSEITISAWIYINSVAGGLDWNCILMKGSWANNGYGFLFQDAAVNNGGGILRFYLPGIGTIDSTPNPFETGKWYHVVGTYDGSYMKIYINSNEVRSVYSGNSLTPTTHNLFIGRNNGVDYPFNGTIDEVRIYNRALSEAEIKALYYEGLTNKFNVTFYMLNEGIADLGSRFTCILFLSNGSTLTKTFSLNTSFGINNPYAQVSVNFNGYYPSYGLIDRIKVCSVECVDMCAEIKKEIEC